MRQLSAWLWQRERWLPAGGQLGWQPGQLVRGGIPLPDQAVGVQHGYSVRARVDHGPLVGSLADDLLERRDVRQRHAGVTGEQLQQLQLDVAYPPSAVEGVQRPVRAPGHVREA